LTHSITKKESKRVLNLLKQMKKIAEMKRVLRLQKDGERKQLTTQQVDEHSRLICQQIVSGELLKLSNDFILYYPFQNEVDLLPLAEVLINAGKDIYFPRYDKVKKRYDLAKIESLSTDFVKGKFGIMEPIATAKSFEKDSLKATWFIPGVAFDQNGNRLGRGGGYYDRFLNKTDGMFVGVAHQVQLVDSVPSEEHDMKMDWLVTEKKTYKLTVVNHDKDMDK